MVIFGKNMVIVLLKKIILSKKQVSKKLRFDLKHKTLKSNLEFTLLEYVFNKGYCLKFQSNLN